MIHPGDTVTLTVSWDAVRVDEALAAWLNANPWAVRYHARGWGGQPRATGPRRCRPVDANAAAARR